MVRAIVERLFLTHHSIGPTQQPLFGIFPNDFWLKDMNLYRSSLPYFPSELYLYGEAHNQSFTCATDKTSQSFAMV